MVYETCFRCGEEYESGYADPYIPYGSLVPFCMDCSEENVEEFLWDVSKLSEDTDLTFYPELENKNWALVNRYGTLDHYWTYMNETNPMDFDRETLDLPENDCWEIFVSSKENTEAIEEARSALREKLE